MSPDDEAQASQARAAKLALIGVFLGSVATFSLRAGRHDDHAVDRPFDLVLLGLASYRIGRMLAYERVAGVRLAGAHWRTDIALAAVEAVTSR